VARCARCGQDSPDQARFCRHCGAPLPAAGTAPTPPPAAATPEQRAQRLLEEAFRLSEEGRILAAVQACQQAITINPDSVSAHSLLGTLYERQGDRESAIHEYEQVLTLSPESTVERRRLNELMGVPTARERIAISARTARLAITGGFLVVALVLVAAIIFTTQPGPGRPRPAQAPGPVEAAAVAVTPAPAAPGEMVPVPGAVRALTGPVSLAAAGKGPSLGIRAPAEQRREQYGQWVAPGTFLFPSGGGQGTSGGVAPRATGMAAPLASIAPYQGTPVVRTPGLRGAPVAPTAGPTPQVGRDYYFQGDYNRAIQAYQGYLAGHPTAGAAPREELAWVYARAGDDSRALAQYQDALNQYQSDVQRGHNVEAARHGTRTCESAIRALEAR